MADTFAGDVGISDDIWLTADEIAARWRSSPATVRRLIREGALASFRPGGERGSYRVRLSAVLAYEADNSQGPEAA